MSLAERSVLILSQKRRDKVAGFDFGLGRFGKGFGSVSSDIYNRMKPLTEGYSSPIMSGLWQGIRHPLQSLGSIARISSPWSSKLQRDWDEAQHLLNRVSRYHPEKISDAQAQLEALKNSIQQHRFSAQFGSGLLGGSTILGTGALINAMNSPKEQEFRYG